MAIVSYEYYTNTYLGEPVSEADFPRYDLRAESVIKSITKGQTDGFASMPASMQEAVQNAICAQIEYFSICGTDIAITGKQSGGFTVGKVSISDSAGVKAGASAMVCPAAIAYLEQTGLLNPAVATIDKPFWWWTI